MRLPATAFRLATPSLLACAAVVQAQTVHDTGALTMGVLGDGFVGASGWRGGHPGFVLAGDDPLAESALYEGQLLVGAGPDQVSGEAYAGVLGWPPEWFNRSGPDTLTAPFPVPFEEFDEGYAARFDDSTAPNPIGLTVIEHSYSSESASDADFVVFEFTIQNTSGADLSDLYVGLFADWDVLGLDQDDDEGGYDAGTRLLFVYDSDGDPTESYFGVAALGSLPISGWDLDAGGGFMPSESELYAAMTNGGSVLPTKPTDLRTVLGTGPYAVPAGGSIVARFAFVTGTDEADLVANAQAAQNTVPVAAEPGTNAGTFALAVAPNPFTAHARLTLTVDDPQHVRVTLYDALGRAVATPFDGALAAGAPQTVEVDGRRLAPGTYFVRVEGEAFAAVRSLVRVR